MSVSTIPRADPGTDSELARANLRRALLGVAAVALLFLVTAIWGRWLNGQGRGIALFAAPLFGTWHIRLGPQILLPVAVAVALVRYGPRVAAEAPWARVVWAAFLAALAWGTALAIADGVQGLTQGVTDRFEYLTEVPRVGSPGAFLQTFTERIDSYVVHVRSHPPGMVLMLWWMDTLGLGGAVPAAAVTILGGAAAVPAVLLAARDVAGEEVARRAAPFLVLAPAAIWLVTSADAFYAGLAAWSAALLVLATGRRDRRGDLFALAGGALFGISLFMAYGLVLVGAVPLAVAIARRRIRPLALAAIPTLVVVGLFAAEGFWWLDGLRETQREYAEGVAGRRPYPYFLVANLAAFSVALGPGPIGGLAVLRDRRIWLLAGGALAAVLLADLSGLSKAEVERIWLPFWPWVALAAAGLTAALRPRSWLAAQAGLTLVLSVVLWTVW